MYNEGHAPSFADNLEVLVTLGVTKGFAFDMLTFFRMSLMFFGLYEIGSHLIVFV